MPILDTDFLIHLGEERPDAIRALRRIQDEALIIPAQTAAEYLVGFTDRKTELEGLGSEFALAHTDDAHVLAMAELRAAARGRSPRARWGDIHVAAQAVLHATYVVTANARDFRALGVPVWDWTHEESPPR